MPIISSTYKAPFLFNFRHINTCFPSLFRKVPPHGYTRERIETQDGDFLDLDCLHTKSDKIAIIVHGMESSAREKSVVGLAKAFEKRGWNVVSINLRGCSGEMNRLLRYYYAGDSKDLKTVVNYILGQKRCSKMVLTGFSLGGNIVLKYLGEEGENIPPEIKKAAAVSVPCDLESCSYQLSRFSNKIYLIRFLSYFKKKILSKEAVFPNKISSKGFDRIKNMYDYDSLYTAPLYGYKSAQEYWHGESANKVIHNIKIPTLVLNAADDPFLSKECFPLKEAQTNPYLFLEMPKHGGHVGFTTFNKTGEYWSETRVTEFLEE